MKIKSKERKGRVQLFRNILKLTKIKDEDLKSKTGGGGQIMSEYMKTIKLKDKSKINMRN